VFPNILHQKVLGIIGQLHDVYAKVLEQRKVIKALRVTGMDDAELQDLIHSIAIFGWANRLMHPLGHSA